MKNIQKRHYLLLCILCFALNCKAQYFVAPEPICGQQLTNELVQLHLVYPENDLQNVVCGKVLVSFFIDKEGMASNFTVKSTFSEAASAEAIRLVKQISWKPAYQDGLAIESEHEFEIKFNAKAYKKAKNKGKVFTTAIPFPDYPLDSSMTIYPQKNVFDVPTPYFDDPKMNIYKYLPKELKYPEQAFAREISGIVTLDFVIEQDGLPSNIVVKESVGGGCDNEAIRLLKGLRWIPATKDKKIVRSSSSLAITFKLGDRIRQNVPNQGGNY